MATQNGRSGDSEICLMVYMETFGTKCYVTPSGKPINCVVGRGGEVASWALYPTEYRFDDAGLRLRMTGFAIVIERVVRRDAEVRAHLRNLADRPVTGDIVLERTSFGAKPTPLSACKVSLGPGQAEEVRLTARGRGRS
jgi:hypothetical protein